MITYFNTDIEVEIEASWQPAEPDVGILHGYWDIDSAQIIIFNKRESKSKIVDGKLLYTDKKYDIIDMPDSWVDEHDDELQEMLCEEGNNRNEAAYERHHDI